jgi:predicted flap endonuclease-1-like 5' DNA nuclease
MYAITMIEGIGEKYAQTLKHVGINTVEALLEAGATPKGRDDLETKTGISHKLILKWVNAADLFRIRGIAEEYSHLLEAAGVDSVMELAQRKPENLRQKLAEVNGDGKIVRALPAESVVTGWVEQAKILPRKITY